MGEQLMSAAAGASGVDVVRILDGKTAAHRSVAIIDYGAVEVQAMFFGCNEFNAVMLEAGIDVRIEGREVVEAEKISQTRTASTGDSHTDDGALIHCLFVNHVADLFRGRFGQCKRHK